MMKRSTQLRRTGFKPTPGRPVHVRTELKLVAVGGAVSKSAMTRNLRMASIAPDPKRPYVRSRTLLAVIGKLDVCTLWCFGQRRPACACHSNWAVHGKGRGIKADDHRIAAGCSDCHRELDQGMRYSEAEKQAIWWRGHVATVAGLLEVGLWPAGVPVPDTAHNPFL